MRFTMYVTISVYRDKTLLSTKKNDAALSMLYRSLLSFLTDKAFFIASFDCSNSCSYSFCGVTTRHGNPAMVRHTKPETNMAVACKTNIGHSILMSPAPNNKWAICPMMNAQPVKAANIPLCFKRSQVDSC